MRWTVKAFVYVISLENSIYDRYFVSESLISTMSDRRPISRQREAQRRAKTDRE